METRAEWKLPEGKRAAVVFSLDDLHPATVANDGYDAGGDMDLGGLGFLRDLLNRHPQLWVTLFVTPDWRETSAYPTRKILSKIPLIRNAFYLAPLTPKGKFRIDRHPEFCAYLRSLPRAEIACHGRDHFAKGLSTIHEFAKSSLQECQQKLSDGKEIFKQAGFPVPQGFAPPAWAMPKELIKALDQAGYKYVNAARDLASPISPSAVTKGSGRQGMSVLFPEILEGANQLHHIPANWSATSDWARAEAIIRSGGVLSIKAHVMKQFKGYTSLDGLDEAFTKKLHELFSRLEAEFGDDLFWTSLSGLVSWPYLPR